jgi:hypothetical protein
MAIIILPPGWLLSRFLKPARGNGQDPRMKFPNKIAQSEENAGEKSAKN